MAESSSEVFEPRVRVVGPSMERHPALIDGAMKKTKLTGNSFTVTVGNTGLRLNFHDTGSVYRVAGDFMPGGYMASSENEKPIAQKDAIRMFCYALYSFRNWAKSSGEINPAKVDYFTSVTNDTFKGFLEKLFTKNGHGDLVKTDFKIPDDPRQVGLDLGKLLQLPDEDPLVVKIRTIAKKAEGTLVPAMVQV